MNTTSSATVTSGDLVALLKAWDLLKEFVKVIPVFVGDHDEWACSYCAATEDVDANEPIYGPEDFGHLPDCSWRQAKELVESHSLTTRKPLV